MFRHISKSQSSSQRPPQLFRKPQKLWMLTLMSIVVVGAVVEPLSALPQSSRHPMASLIAQRRPHQGRPNQNQTRLPNSVVRQVRRDLAAQANVPQGRLRVVNYSRETWPDSCLGLARDNERCAMAIVEGWRVELTDGQRNWVYRSDLTGTVIRMETHDPASLPPQVIERLLETIAREGRVPASSLRVVETQPRVFDGCMGVYAPDVMCTRIAISGWSVIVAGENQSWVYHVSEDASRIVLNPTASGSRGDLVPSFIPTDVPEPVSMERDIIFRRTVSGGMGGFVSERVLLADGTLYQRDLRMGVPQTPEPVIEKRLSPQQVQQFQQLLQDQRFPNLHGLRYITDAAFADYPTTRFEGMSRQVEYIDLEQDNLPRSLQTIITAWESL